MKTKAIYRFILILIVTILASAYQLNLRTDTDLVHLNSKNPRPETDPDKYLLIGEWSQTGTSYLIKITGLLDTGKLEVGYYNPYKYEIQKANWTKIGTLLSVYIELQDPLYPGSSFKLNYIPERDVLVGYYFDPADGMEYAVEFIRIR